MIDTMLMFVVTFFVSIWGIGNTSWGFIWIIISLIIDIIYFFIRIYVVNFYDNHNYSAYIKWKVIRVMYQINPKKWQYNTGFSHPRLEYKVNDYSWIKINTSFLGYWKIKYYYHLSKKKKKQNKRNNLTKQVLESMQKDINKEFVKARKCVDKAEEECREYARQFLF